MALEISEVTPVIGARVSGVDIARLSDADFAAIEQAWHRRAFVLIRDQKLSDDDLLAYWRQTLSSSWHMTGTLKMGKPGDADAVVDPDFKLIGFEGLRVADMSAVPVLASGHTQAIAYVTGLTAAEKLRAEYNLN